MLRKTNISFLVITIILTILISGCRSTKTAIAPSDNSNAGMPSVVKEESDLSPAKRVAAMVDSYKTRSGWTDINVPVKCNLRSPKSLSVSGRMVMVKGQSISLSMRMLGFEVAGLYADCDSIYIYEKLNKSMVVEPMSRLTASTGVTLSDLQDLLTGVMCYPGKDLNGGNVTKLFDIAVENNTIQLLPHDNRNWAFALSDENIPVLTAAVAATAKVNAVCQFGAPQLCNAGVFIPSVSVYAEAGKQKLDASLVYTLSDLKINSGAKASKPSVKGYNRIALDRLIKALGAF